jgi:transcriptional regulator with GAF, ATPase, and Fis domain
MTASTKRTQEPDLGPLGIVVYGGGAAYGFALPPGRDLEAGREADLTIDHESVSRRHVRFEWTADSLFVRDLESTNGTRVNGRKLAPKERAPIGVGASLLLGHVSVLVQPLEAVRDVASGREPRRDPLDGVVANAPAMKALFSIVDLVAPSELPLLLVGETGSGKEILATSIHRLSGRKDKPFVAINCASLPETILESELFGYERGAFTGAVQSKPGLFESADGGTLFLDEIGETTLATQAKLLRILGTGEVTRLGSVRPKHIDVRLVSATNRNLEAQLQSAGSFRADLYYRIAGMTLRVPSLRERPLDIRPLAEHFVAHFSRKAGRPAPSLSARAIAALEGRAWPGNARELRNVMQRATVLAGASSEITEAHLALESGVEAVPLNITPSSQSTPPAAPNEAGMDLRTAVDRFERDRIIEALKQADGNQTRAAALLGIARRTLVAKIEQHGLDRPRKRT